MNGGEFEGGTGPVSAVASAASIILPLDGSEEALAALPVARSIARLEDTVLHVVHIADKSIPPGHLLRKLALDRGDVEGSIVDQVMGEPIEGILRIAEEQKSPYIVMCTRTGTGETSEELGNVTRGVLCRARCPVVLVPPERGRGEEWVPRRILVPYDGTPTTATAACPALDFARRAGADLSVLHVTSPGSTGPLEPGSITAPRYVDQAQHEWPAWAKEFLDRVCWAPELAGRIRLLLSVGSPGEEICRFGRELGADLIVLGWHGSWDGAHAAAVKRTIRDASCPLLMVRLGTCSEAAEPR